MIRKMVASVLFVRDLAACTAFYRDTLGLTMADSDADSSGFKIGDVYFILLNMAEAGRLIGKEPLALATDGGPRGLTAVEVEDVDATYDAFKAKGVTFLKPPVDQSWGLRTAHFADPEGNLWEIHQSIVSKPKQ